MAAGDYEAALPIALEALAQGTELFKPSPALQLFPLYLLAAQVGGVCVCVLGADRQGKAENRQRADHSLVAYGVVRGLQGRWLKSRSHVAPPLLRTCPHNGP
jgi:hypothetical protein